MRGSGKSSTPSPRALPLCRCSLLCQKAGLRFSGAPGIASSCLPFPEARCFLETLGVWAGGPIALTTHREAREARSL